MAFTGLKNTAKCVLMLAVVVGSILCDNTDPLDPDSYTDSANDDITMRACGWEDIKPAEVLSTIVITSPQYPNGTYMLNENCHWHIQAPYGKVVKLNFSLFDLEPVFECSFAYLEVHDGDSLSDDNYLARFCGQTVPGATYSSSHDMYMEFSSQSQGSGRGFVAQVDFVDVTSVACGPDQPVVIDWDQGGFVSPDFPTNYPLGAECSWMLENDKDLRLNFLEWAVRPVDEHGVCVDYVAMYDGQEEHDEHSLGTYCGYNVPSPKGKSKDALLVTFTSSTDVEEAYPGRFRATFSTTNLTEKACSGHKRVEIDWAPGHIKAPLTEQSDCEWVLTAPEGMVIRFEIEWFDLPDCSNCGCAEVSFYNGVTFDESDLIGAYCHTGWSQPYIQSGGNTAGVMYDSYKLDGHEAFSIKYSFYDFSEVACSDQRPIVLTHDYGIIASPGYNLHKYPNNAYCEWAVQTVVGKVVEVNFLDFEIEPCLLCDCDVLYMYNGAEPLAENEIMHGYCDIYGPAMQKTSLPGLYFSFYSDSAGTFRGFKAEYWIRDLAEIACGSSQPVALDKSPGDILSPNYGQGEYPLFSRCQWLLSTVFEERIQLDFVDFKLEYDVPGRCQFDSLTVYDGETRDSPVLAFLCGSEYPTRLTSSQRFMLIEFSSNNAIGDTGFHLSFQHVEPIPSNTTAVILMSVLIGFVVLVTGFILCLYYKRPEYFKCRKKTVDRRPRLDLSSVGNNRSTGQRRPGSSSADPEGTQGRSRSTDRGRRPSSDTISPYPLLRGLPTFEESNNEALIRPPSYKDLLFIKNYALQSRGDGTTTRTSNIPPPSYIEALSHTLIQQHLMSPESSFLSDATTILAGNDAAVDPELVERNVAEIISRFPSQDLSVAVGSSPDSDHDRTSASINSGSVSINNSHDDTSESLQSQEHVTNNIRETARLQNNNNLSRSHYSLMSNLSSTEPSTEQVVPRSETQRRQQPQYQRNISVGAVTVREGSHTGGRAKRGRQGANDVTSVSCWDLHHGAGGSTNHNSANRVRQDTTTEGQHGKMKKTSDRQFYHSTGQLDRLGQLQLSGAREQLQQWQQLDSSISHIPTRTYGKVNSKDNRNLAKSRKLYQSVDNVFATTTNRDNSTLTSDLRTPDRGQALSARNRARSDSNLAAMKNSEGSKMGLTLVSGAPESEV